MEIKILAAINLAKNPKNGGNPPREKIFIYRIHLNFILLFITIVFFNVIYLIVFNYKNNSKWD